MFAELHSDINTPKSGFLHLIGQPYWKKSRSAKVKDGIITYFLGTISLMDTEGIVTYFSNLVTPASTNTLAACGASQDLCQFPFTWPKLVMSPESRFLFAQKLTTSRTRPSKGAA
jgi:hypothetical protein